MIERGVTEGGRIVAGGERLGGDHANGFFLPLTIVADVANDSEIARNEVFGPVLSVTPFDSEDEAIALANDTELWPRRLHPHHQPAPRAPRRRVRPGGQVQVNGAGEAMTPCVPFGGMKQSGYGRLGGEDGLHEFLQAKNVWMNLGA